MLTALALFCGKAYGQGKVTLLSPGQSITAKTTFAVSAAGFQWYRNGVAIAGAVNATYVINQPGTYAVQAFNQESCPSPMSDSFEIRLNTPSASPSGITADVDLSIVKSSETRAVLVNEAFEYTLTVKNNSTTTAANNVVITDPLPANLTYVSASTFAAYTPLYDPNTKTISWKITNLAAGSVATLQFMATASQSGSVTNTATVKGDEPDLIFTNNNTSTDIKQILPITIPNVFTPNGDNKNEAFELPTVLTSVSNEIQIFNRWGNEVYTKKNYHNEWTGNGLNEGTYFYILKAQNTTGAFDVYKGYVTLLRNKQNL